MHYHTKQNLQDYDGAVLPESSKTLRYTGTAPASSSILRYTGKSVVDRARKVKESHDVSSSVALKINNFH